MALRLELHHLVRGNPGALFLGLELHHTNQMTMNILVPLLRQLGLLGNSFYILHKEFGGKEYERTVEILEALRVDPQATFPLVRGGELCEVLHYCLAEMRGDG